MAPLDSDPLIIRMPEFSLISRSPARSRLMLRFVLSAAAIYVAVGLAAWLMIRALPVPESPAEAIFPPAFWLSTGLLIAASVMMQRAVFFVRLERQVKFRKSLLAALGLGASFVAIQSYGLSCLIRHQSPGEVETGANAFLTMLAALHAMHVTLALMLLTWVTLSAVADRYDHEYYLGPLFCAWFWHGLGIVWMMIMIIFLIATNYLSPRNRTETAIRRISIEVTRLERPPRARLAGESDSPLEKRI